MLAGCSADNRTRLRYGPAVIVGVGIDITEVPRIGTVFEVGVDLGQGMKLFGGDEFWPRVFEAIHWELCHGPRRRTPVPCMCPLQ